MVRRLFFLLCCLTLVCARPGGAAELVLLLGDTTGPHGEFATSLQSALAGKKTHRLQEPIPFAAADKLPPHADLLITVGSDALRAALASRSNTPILATLVARQSYERLLAEFPSARKKGGVSAFWLDQPDTRLLIFAQALLPQARRPGIMVGTVLEAQAQQLKQRAQRSGLDPLLLTLDEHHDPIARFAELFEQSDYLLALPDSSVFRRESVKSILLTSYRYQKPIIAFSPAFVTAGALAAIHTTPSQSAQQVADWLEKFDPAKEPLPSPQPPAYYAVAINRSVAQAMGLYLPDEASLRRQIDQGKTR